MAEDRRLSKAMRSICRSELMDNLRQRFETTLDQRVDRFLEINRQDFIGDHHFASASSECILLYRDGYFISAVMVSQAVNEGILKFVAERNGVARQGHPKMIEELQAKAIISAECASASTRIWESFRNDIHHMNPCVTGVPFPDLAKRNLQDLALIEREIFGVDRHGGKLIPRKPKHWDIKEDGTMPVYLRLEM